MRVLLVLLLLPSLLAAAPDWTQWRGPTRDGQVHAGAQPWPPRLEKDTLQPLWSVPLAEGYSSPVVSGSRVFTFETRNKKEEIVRAFDRKTGQPIWKASWAGSMKVPFFARKNGSWVRSSPACDGTTLYVGGMRDVLVALDVATGKERWRTDFPQADGTAKPQFGFVCSPLLGPDHLYVQAGSALRKIRKSDGKTIWKALEDDRAMFGSAFSSPVRARIHGRDQVVVQSRMALGGVDPGTGTLLWSTPVKASRGMNILTPTVLGNDLFTASYGGGSFYFRISPGNGVQSVDLVWNDKLEGYMSSPVVIGGKLYLHARDKRFHCLDPATGRILWSTEQTFGAYWSMVVNGTRILALDERGELLLIEADPAGFQLIDRLDLDRPPTWAHLAVCGKELYIRDLTGLTVYRWN
mgnify:CR=1 FL=1